VGAAAVLSAVLGVLLPWLLAQSAVAQGLAPTPIPQNPSDVAAVPAFIGSPVGPKAASAPTVPQNPFMAPNGRSNLHDDAYMTNTYLWSGPLGNNMRTLSTFQGAECASLTFDSLGRIAGICIGLEGPRLVMFDPQTLDLLAVMPLPPRSVSASNPFTQFSGGGYFYLDQSDRAVIPTTNDQIWVVGETTGITGPGFALQRAYDVSAFMSSGDQIISALPDWSGRIWFATIKGIVGTIDPVSGAVRAMNMAEAISWSPIAPCTGSMRRLTGRRWSPGARPTQTSASSSPVKPRMALERHQT
jgi:hypothetical protein